MERILIRAGWVLPVATTPIEDGAVLIEGDRIIAVDKYAAFENTPGISREMGGPEAWLLPGLVNSHYHSGRSFQLGYSDEPGELGLFRTFSHIGLTIPHEAEEFAYLDTLSSAFQLLRSGITTTIDMAWGGASLNAPHTPAIHAYRDLGLRTVFAPIARDRCAYVYGEDEVFLASLPPDLATRIEAAELGQSIRITPQDYLVEWETLYDRYDDSNLMRLIVALDGPVWCSDVLTRTVVDWANRHQLPLHLHNAESKFEVDWALATLGKTTTAHLQELGVLRPGTSLAHGIWVTNDDMQRCVENGVSIIHTPSSDLRWYAGIAPIVDWVQSGVNVALGTDSNGFSDDNDLLSEIRMASLLQRVPGLLDWPGLTPEVILSMATINGARAFSLEDQIGTIEPGKRADLVLLAGDRVRGPLVNPRHNVYEVLVRRAWADHVRTVLVGGRVLLDEGRIMTVDEDRVLQEVRSYYEMLWNQTNQERQQLIEEGLVHVRRFFKPWEANLLPARYRYNCS